MPRCCLFLFLIFSLTFTGFAQTNPQTKTDSLETVVIKLFTALAELDTAKARSFCTSDIRILESGQIWNFDSLALRISTRKTKSPDFKRVNQFDFIETRIFENTGYVSYFNQAIISFDGRTTRVRWIETVILKREKDGWKIALLHSTELERNS